MVGIYFSQTSVFIFAGDLAAVRIIGVSVIATCPQGESWLYCQRLFSGVVLYPFVIYKAISC